MTIIFSTKLLGRERAETSVPYQNINGDLFAENGSLVFRSNSGETLWIAPFENVVEYDCDWDTWRNDLSHLITNFFGEAATLGFLSPNRYLYLWIRWHDERVGKMLVVRFLVSDAWLDVNGGRQVVRTIGEHIGSYRDTLRRATL